MERPVRKNEKLESLKLERLELEIFSLRIPSLFLKSCEIRTFSQIGDYEILSMATPSGENQFFQKFYK